MTAEAFRKKSHDWFRAHPSPPCRRCTECVGETHHWMGPEPDPRSEAPLEDRDVVFICKHCDYVCPASDCDACGDFVPHDITTQATNGATLCPHCAAEEDPRS